MAQSTLACSDSPPLRAFACPPRAPSRVAQAAAAALDAANALAAAAEAHQRAEEGAFAEQQRLAEEARARALIEHARTHAGHARTAAPAHSPLRLCLARSARSPTPLLLCV